MAIKVRAAATHKVYHHWARKLWLVASGLEFLAAILISANESSMWISAPALLAGIYFLWLGFSIRLVISPAGIAYDTMSLYSVVTPWSNVEQIAEIPFRSGGTIRALILREPAATGWRQLDAALLPEHRGRVIPLSGTQTRMWRRIDQLEQEIQHYAPHVLL